MAGRNASPDKGFSMRGREGPKCLAPIVVYTPRVAFPGSPGPPPDGFGHANFGPVHKKPLISIDNGDLRQYKFGMGLGNARTIAPTYAFLAVLAVTLTFTPTAL